MYNNLVKEGFKKEFFGNKDKVINDYIEPKIEEGYYYKVFTYTKGSKVGVDEQTGMAYSRTGFFFSVILKDEDYINKLDQLGMLKALDESFAPQYDVEYEDED